MADIEIKCGQEGCSEVRLFTERDQKFYEEKGYSKPKYCRTHSAERKARHNNKVEDNQQEQRNGWDRSDDRGRGPRFPEQEGDADMLA